MTFSRLVLIGNDLRNSCLNTANVRFFGLTDFRSEAEIVLELDLVRGLAAELSRDPVVT